MRPRIAFRTKSLAKEDNAITFRIHRARDLPLPQKRREDAHALRKSGKLPDEIECRRSEHPSACHLAFTDHAPLLALS